MGTSQNKPDRANRRQPLDFLEHVGEAGVRGSTAAVAHPGRSVRNIMRMLNFIAALAVLGVCGCDERPVSSPNQPVAANKSASTPQPATDTTATMVGTWHSRESSTLLELAGDERWKWWDLREQSGRPSEPPMLAGSWFVRKGILFLRIEQTKEEPERIGPGLAFTFDVKSVTQDEMVVHQMRDKDEMKFRRIAEPGAANASQPFRSETNSTSPAADSQHA